MDNKHLAAILCNAMPTFTLNIGKRVYKCKQHHPSH